MANIQELKPVNSVQNIINKFCYTIGMIPTSYKLSLSYEEQVIAIGRYLEETVIPALNNNAEAVVELQNLYIELKNYVDNYFNDLDVQEEINKKLDEMAQNGELKELMQPFFNDLIEKINQFQENLNQTNGNLDLEKQTRKQNDDNLQSQINSLVLSEGNPDSSSAEIVQARSNILGNTFATLNDRISYIEKTVPFSMGVAEQVDFNSYITPGKYIVTSVSSNNPKVNNVNLGSSGILIVEALQPSPVLNPSTYQWIQQHWYPLNFNGTATRTIQRINTEDLQYKFYDWIIYDNYYLNKLYTGLNRESLSNDYNSVSILRNNVDFNTLKESGIYINTNSNNPNIPFVINQGGILNVETFYKENDSYRWIVQTYRNISLTKIAQRIFRESMLGDNIGELIFDSDWKIIYNDTQNQGFGLNGKTIVNFGDSIFGNYRDNTSVSNNIAGITNANVINLGFGGCRMSDRQDSYTTWNPFSMCNLATSIVNKNFTSQDTAINNQQWNDKPSYFAEALNTLKSLDFTKVDYITIAYGTNDYTAGTLLDNDENPYDQTTWAGALRYTIETLLSAYPNLRILIGSPIWRCWLNNEKTEIQYTSDDRTFPNGNYTLSQMVQKAIEIGKNYHIPVLNAYDNLSFNKFNWSSIFSTSDTTHPNEYGRACLGKEYAYALCNM